MIYCGPEDNIQPHLESLGFQFPDHTNPADVMGDIIAGEGRHYKPKGDASVQGLIDHWATRQKDPASLNKHMSTISVAETNSLSATVKQRGAPWYKQIWFCYRRSILVLLRIGHRSFGRIPHWPCRTELKGPELPWNLQRSLRDALFLHRLRLSAPDVSPCRSFHRPHSLCSRSKNLR
jgi:hypothetical protein